MASYQRMQVENPPPPVVTTYKTVHFLKLTDAEMKSLKFLLNALDTSLAPDLAELKSLITHDPDIIQTPLELEVRKPVAVAPDVTPDKNTPAPITVTEVP